MKFSTLNVRYKILTLPVASAFTDNKKKNNETYEIQWNYNIKYNEEKKLENRIMIECEV